MKRITLLFVFLLLTSGLVFADGVSKKHRRAGRPCGRYTIYKHRKIHYRVGRPCGHKKSTR